MRRLFVPLLLTLVVAGFVMGGVYDRKGKTEVTSELRGELEGVRLHEQADAERIFRERPLERVLTLGRETGAPLFGPLVVKEGPREEIYVLDSGDLSIKRFSPQGKLLATYGAGKGQGPGEFQALTDFAVDDSGEVWAVDPNNGRLTVFAPAGKVARTIRLEQPPYRLSLAPGGAYFVTFMLIRDQIFGRFAPPQRLTREFGTFLTRQGLNAMVLDGWVAPDGGGGFVYAGFFAGVLARYDSAGRPRFYSELLGRTELPKVLRDSQGRRWIDREAPVTAASLSVSSRGIHVLGIYRSGLKMKGKFDTYDLATGTYRESMALPERCQGAVLTERHLYTVQETAVAKWRLAS